MTRARLRVPSGTFRWATRPSRQLPDSTAGGVRNPPVPDDTIGQDVVPESSHDAEHSKKVLGPSRGVPVCVRAPVQPWCGLPDWLHCWCWSVQGAQNQANQATPPGNPKGR